MRTASTIIANINKKIHNAKDKIGGSDGLLRLTNEAVDWIQDEVDLAGSKRRTAPFMIYPKIYEYPAPDGLVYDRAIQLVDEQDRLLDIDFCTPTEFFRERNPFQTGYASPRSSLTLGNIMQSEAEMVGAVEFQDGQSFFLFRGNEKNSPVTLHALTDFDENGTWSISGDGQNLRQDTTSWKEGNSSVGFDSAGGSTTIVLTNSTLTAVDLSTIASLGAGFLDLRFPVVPSSVTVRWGSSSGDYWEASATTRQNGLSFQIGWNLLKFDWRGLTATGSPSSTAVDYVRITITLGTATAASNWGVNFLRFANGRHYSAQYYSSYVAKTTANVFQSEFTSPSDTSVLRDEEDRLIEHMAAVLGLHELRETVEADNRFERYVKPKLEEYEVKNPSQKKVKGYAYYHI